MLFQRNVTVLEKLLCRQWKKKIFTELLFSYFFILRYYWFEIFSNLYFIGVGRYISYFLTKQKCNLDLTKENKNNVKCKNMLATRSIVALSKWHDIKSTFIWLFCCTKGFLCHFSNTVLYTNIAVFLLYALNTHIPLILLDFS